MNIDRWRQFGYGLAAFLSALVASLPDDQSTAKWAGIAAAVAVALKAFLDDPKKDK